MDLGWDLKRLCLTLTLVANVAVLDNSEAAYSVFVALNFKPYVAHLLRTRYRVCDSDTFLIFVVSNI